MPSNDHPPEDPGRTPVPPTSSPRSPRAEHLLNWYITGLKLLQDKEELLKQSEPTRLISEDAQ